MSGNKLNFGTAIERLSNKDGITSIRVIPDTGHAPVTMEFKSDYDKPQDLGIDLMKRNGGKLKEMIWQITGHDYGSADKQSRMMMEMHVAVRLAIRVHNEVGKNAVKEASYRIEDLQEVASPKIGDRTQHFAFNVLKDGQQYASGTFSYGIHDGDNQVSAKIDERIKEYLISYHVRNNNGNRTHDIVSKAENEIEKMEGLMKREAKRHFDNEKARDLSLQHDNVMSFSR